MKVIVVDDEPLALEHFKDVTSEINEISQVNCFIKASKALEFAEDNEINIAFLDVEMPGISGIELAKKLHSIDEDINIVFITGYEKYALDAFSVDGIAYILKPYSESEINKAIEKAKRFRGTKIKNRVMIKTFGGFDLFIDDKMVKFKRSKAKELLAILVDRRGTSMTNSEIATYLWEERAYDDSVKESFKKALQSLKHVLKEYKVEEILKDSYNVKSVDVTKFRCDYYDFLDNNKLAVNQYLGEYMSSYSWAEETNAELYMIKMDK